MPPMKSAKRKAPNSDEAEDTVALAFTTKTQEPIPTAAHDVASKVLSFIQLCYL